MIFVIYSIVYQMGKKIEVLGSLFRHHVVLFALNRVVVDGGNNITLISNSEEVALTLERTSRVNSGYWNCSAQVYDTDSLKVGKPVEKTVQLVIVGEFAFDGMYLSSPSSPHPFSPPSGTSKYFCQRDWSHMGISSVVQSQWWCGRLSSL